MGWTLKQAPGRGPTPVANCLAWALLWHLTPLQSTESGRHFGAPTTRPGRLAQVVTRLTISDE